MFRLRVKDTFSAAHSLRYYQGKCEAMHGHNFEVEVEVQGDVLEDKTEILFDFKKLKRLLKSVLEQLDHTCLNDLTYFQQVNPSSENIAKYIFDQLKTKLPDKVGLNYVMVAEGKNSMAFYEQRSCVL